MLDLASRGDGKSVWDSTRCPRSLTRGIVPSVAVAFLVAVAIVFSAAVAVVVAVAVVLSVALAAAPFLFLSFFVPV